MMESRTMIMGIVIAMNNLKGRIMMRALDYWHRAGLALVQREEGGGEEPMEFGREETMGPLQMGRAN